MNCCRTTSHAARKGHLECLQFFYQIGYNFKYIDIEYAVKYGQLDCLRYLHQSPALLVEEEYHYDRLIAYAASNGHLDCLIYLHEKGYLWFAEICESAAAGGHLDCLRYAHQHGCHLTEWVTFKAAAFGHLDCLKYAHENGCPWHVQTCQFAAWKGHLECLIYAYQSKLEFPAHLEKMDGVKENSSNLIEENRDEESSALLSLKRENSSPRIEQREDRTSSPWNEKVLEFAADGGNFECLKYAHYTNLLEFGESCILVKGMEKACQAAAAGGHLDCLKYLHEKGYPLDEWSYRFALAYSKEHPDQLACLKYLYTNDCPTFGGERLEAEILFRKADSNLLKKRLIIDNNRNYGLSRRFCLSFKNS